MTRKTSSPDAAESSTGNTAIDPVPRNRLLRLIDGEIEKYRENERNIGLINLKLLSFRNVVNYIGFSESDALLLKTIADIKDILKHQDAVYRSSDDELVIILPNLMNDGHIVLAASRIRHLFENPVKVANSTMNIRVGMGMALFPEHADTSEKLLLNASKALAEGMQNGWDYNIYSGDEKSIQRSNIVIEAQLGAAIAANELSVYYQPKIDIKNRTVYGVEALARWNHPEHGLLQPGFFIPLAEKANLINSLMVSVLNTAFKDAREWRGIGANLALAVNLSTANLKDELLMENIQRAINLWDFSPGNLIFEITENSIMSDPDVSLRVMHNIRSSGAGFSIDNFGAGSSSLACLKNLPLAELKIDKSFVRNMLHIEGDNMLVKSIIDLAHNFNLYATATGVESQETLNRLRMMHCDYVQGYLISKPMPTEQFKQWMKNSGWNIRPL